MRPSLTKLDRCKKPPLYGALGIPGLAWQLGLRTYMTCGKVKTVLTVPSGVGSRSTNTSSRVVV